MKLSTMPMPLVLNIGHLKRKGLLDSERFVSSVNIGAKVRVFPNKDGLLLVEIRKEAAGPRQSPNGPAKDEWISHTAAVVYRERKFGRRPYFVCPISGKDCLKLLFHGDIAASPAAFRQLRLKIGGTKAKAVSYASVRAKLLKLDGRSRRAPFRREAVIKRLEGLKANVELDPELEEVLKQDKQRKERDQQKWLWEQRPISTTKGLERGRGAFQHSAFEDYLRLSPSQRREIAPERSELPQPLCPDSIEFYPALDVRVLLDREWLKGDRARAIWLGWPQEWTDERRIMMIDDGREHDRLLIFRIESPATVTWQRIPLLYRSSERPRHLLCPVLSEARDILYFREGRFASREAQKLYNPSQRAEGRRKAAQNTDARAHE